MARKARPQGRLIALEGTRGQDVLDAAHRLWRRLEKTDVRGGVSQWDASGTFYEMQLGKRKALTPSPRTLLLLYASDLVFRLRWEIRPALETGQLVIAAPYVETAIAFGQGCGLPRRWLTQLFAFAPDPHACYRIKERKKKSGWKGKPSDGYLEFCSSALALSSARWNPADARAKTVAHLVALERRNGCLKLTRKRLIDAASVR